MHEVTKFLRRKDYNPCGELVGNERELCDEAAENFRNLPFAEVMRAVVVKALARFEHAENFSNVDALRNWAAFDQSADERRASLNFDTFTPLQAGLAKFLAHVLHENRYNIHCNALTDYCRTLDAKAFPAALTADALEREIDLIAQRADYSATVNELIERLWNFLAA